jgi:hypothetical protein
MVQAIKSACRVMPAEEAAASTADSAMQRQPRSHSPALLKASEATQEPGRLQQQPRCQLHGNERVCQEGRKACSSPAGCRQLPVVSCVTGALRAHNTAAAMSLSLPATSSACEPRQSTRSKIIAGSSMLQRCMDDRQQTLLFSWLASATPRKARASASSHCGGHVPAMLSVCCWRTGKARPPDCMLAGRMECIWQVYAYLATFTII